MDANNFATATLMERPAAIPLYGAVDKFDAPATIGGWVNTAADPGKGHGVTILIYRHGRIIAAGKLTFSRTDIIDDPDYLTGFEVKCDETIPDSDFAFGGLTVETVDENGHQTPLSLYEPTRTTALERAMSAAAPFGKAAASVMLTALARNEEFAEDEAAALRDVNDRFFHGEDRALLYNFESLGADCSLGALQRMYGAEPLGLWRFSGVNIDSLITALGNRLAGIGTPEFTRIYTDEHGEYYTRDTRYHMPTHSYVYQGEVEEEKFYRERCRQISFLVRNMLEKLQKGQRIFVIHDLPRPIAEDKLEALLDAMRRYGNAPLLYLQVAGPGQPAGTVRRRDDGILSAFVPNIRGDVMNPDAQMRESWLRALRRAHAMVG